MENAQKSVYTRLSRILKMMSTMYLSCLFFHRKARRWSRNKLFFNSIKARYLHNIKTRLFFIIQVKYIFFIPIFITAMMLGENEIKCRFFSSIYLSSRFQAVSLISFVHFQKKLIRSDLFDLRSWIPDLNAKKCRI